MLDTLATPMQLLDQGVSAILPTSASATTHDFSLLAATLLGIWVIWRIARRMLSRLRARVLAFVLPAVMLVITQTPALAGSANQLWENPVINDLIPAGFLGGWGTWLITYFLFGRRRRR